MSKQLVRSASVALVISAAASANASVVHLTGDYGAFDYHGIPSLGIGSDTLNFSHSVPGRGNIYGDLVSNNSGSNFTMALTNLTFDTTGVTPGVMTQIRLRALQVFAVTTAGPVLAQHSVSGLMGSDGGGGLVFCNTITNFGSNGVSIPTISYGSPNGNVAPFSAGPAFANTFAGGPFYSIQMQIDLVIDGNGFIHMDNSYDSSAAISPAPASTLLLGCAALSTIRRRRA